MSVEKRWKIHKKLEIVAGILCCLVGILFIYSGGKVNYNANKIKENGLKAEAIILNWDVEKRLHVAGRVKYICLVKFIVGEQERIGKAISSDVVFAGEHVNIYYLPDSLDEVEDVVIDIKSDFDGPGSNSIDSGIFFLTVGIVFFLYVKGK